VNPESTQAPTPAEVRALAGRAQELAREIQAMARRMETADGGVRRAGFRLREVSATVRQIAAEITATGAGLDRVRAAAAAGRCGMPWGVCPADGNTLTSTGGRSRCRVCGYRWEYDRAGSPCTEPVSHAVTDATGATRETCTGHALAARTAVIGATITRLG
jgi:hypothetical protein